MADIVHAENAAGDQAFGVEVDGVFVPFAIVAKHRVDQLVERGKDLAQKVKSGDDSLAGPAQLVLDGEFKVGGKSESGEPTTYAPGEPGVGEPAQPVESERGAS